MPELEPCPTNLRHMYHDPSIPMLVAASGGRTSMFMLYYLKSRFPERPIYAGFANTSKERIETITFIKDFMKTFGIYVAPIEAKFVHGQRKGVEYDVVNWDSLKMDGSIYEDGLKKHGIPFRQGSWCSSEMKTQALRKWMQDLIGKEQYITCIGIRIDEAHRINRNTQSKYNKFYPLADDLKADKAFIAKWWERQSFDLQLKSYQGNCDYCFKKSFRNLYTLIKENATDAHWWAEMERKYGNHKRQTFFRLGRSMNDVIQEAEQYANQLSHDTVSADRRQTTMFPVVPEITLPTLEVIDQEEECFCKSSED